MLPLESSLESVTVPEPLVNEPLIAVPETFAERLPSTLVMFQEPSKDLMVLVVLLHAAKATEAANARISTFFLKGLLVFC